MEIASRLRVIICLPITNLLATVLGKGTEYYSLGELSSLSYLSGTPVDGRTRLTTSTRGISNLWPDLCERSAAPNDKYRFIKQPY